ncbi:MAG TPA: UDP-N-acetylmuramoyl-L-alanine--D-glutamate ligase [Candidatus Hydrogenedentes bacterium]|nr:UDP-N-acetylmuramoyl-L-alanine--D-glutamate ligase [Candidatus Hydrogenedentota bacterium]
MTSVNLPDPPQLAGKRVTIIGLGRSAVAAARLVRQLGATPFISEKEDTPKMAPWKAACEKYQLPVETGGHTERAYDADLFVLSPGVPLNAPVARKAADSGIPITGELELASRCCRAPLLAVTGTNGKTTTTVLLYHVLRHAGYVADLAGNNDRPLSEVVLDSVMPQVVVVEVSSYQLETTATFHPVVAAALNVTPDHLARHGSMEAYATTKSRIFARQQAGDTAVLNADDAWTDAMEPPGGVSIVRFSARRELAEGAWFDGTSLRLRDRALARREDLRIPGLHNVANALAVAAMADAFGVDLGGFAEALRVFPGVEHRIEWVAETDGITWYNDSKSTNPDSLRIALEAFDQPVILIAGGQHKEGADYQSLKPLVARKVSALIAIGDSGDYFTELYGDKVPHVRLRGVEEAIAHARNIAQRGAIVLFSPGCASFDQYNNYEERGRHFKDQVRLLAGLNCQEILG